MTRLRVIPAARYRLGACPCTSADEALILATMADGALQRYFTPAITNRDCSFR